MKNQNIVCVFAHPDDEAFGPAGTIAKWSEHNNVYIICVTDGSNPNGNIKNLKNVRNEELKNSAKILGVKEVFYLGYCDGELYNNIYHKVAKDIENIFEKLKPTILMTFEFRGVSGHIDHIFVTMVTTFLYNKLGYIKKIYYYAEFKLISEFMKNYFIFFPEGYDREEVDYVEDVSKTTSKRIESIKVHKSQSKDGDLILKKVKYFPKEEYFFVREKNILQKIRESSTKAKEISSLLLHNLKTARMVSEAE